MRETGMRGATDGNRRDSFVSGTEVRASTRKRRERVTANVVASTADLERLQAVAEREGVRDVTLHVTKRGDVRLVTYIDESRRK